MSINNSRKQGAIGLGKAVKYFTEKGYPVLLPIAEVQRFDLAILKDDKLYKVECKTSTYKRPDSPSFSIQLKTCGGNKSGSKPSKKISSKDADLLFVWCSDNSQYLIPISEIEGKSSINLGYDYNKYMIIGDHRPKPFRNRKPRMKKKTKRSKRKTLYTQKAKRKCAGCTKKIDMQNRYCMKCFAKTREVTTWPEDKELIALIKNSNFSKVGDQLGVSDNAVRKRLKNRGLLHLIKGA